MNTDFDINSKKALRTTSLAAQNVWRLAEAGGNSRFSGVTRSAGLEGTALQRFTDFMRERRAQSGEPLNPLISASLNQNAETAAMRLTPTSRPMHLPMTLHTLSLGCQVKIPLAQ
jgi:hypothetical protein